MSNAPSVAVARKVGLDKIETYAIFVGRFDDSFAFKRADTV